MADERFVEGSDPFHPDWNDREQEALFTRLGEAINHAKGELQQRQLAYIRTFKGLGVPGDIDKVLLDLARFCRADTVVFSPDPYTMALMAGRLEVLQRILDHTGLSLDALYVKYHEKQGAR